MDMNLVCLFLLAATHLLKRNKKELLSVSYKMKILTKWRFLQNEDSYKMKILTKWRFLHEAWWDNAKIQAQQNWTKWNHFFNVLHTLKKLQDFLSSTIERLHLLKLSQASRNSTSAINCCHISLKTVSPPLEAFRFSFCHTQRTRLVSFLAGKCLSTLMKTSKTLWNNSQKKLSHLHIQEWF